MMKRRYISPELDMITLTLKDVILTSGGNEDPLTSQSGSQNEDDLDDPFGN